MQDQIVRAVSLAVPPERAYAAIADHLEFGNWFRARLDAPFRLGQISRGVVIDQAGAEHPLWVRVEAMEPGRRFAFRWPMLADVEPDGPDLAAKTTLVSFDLAPEGASGTRLTITESGFASLPPDTGPELRQRNEGGWDIQAHRVAAYLGR